MKTTFALRALDEIPKLSDAVLAERADRYQRLLRTRRRTPQAFRDAAHDYLNALLTEQADRTLKMAMAQ